jgi:hypothetical protein
VGAVAVWPAGRHLSVEVVRLGGDRATWLGELPVDSGNAMDVDEVDVAS